MSLVLLHISDIHPIPGQDLGELAERIGFAAKEKFEIQFLVVSGDLGFQGQHHDMAARFINHLKRVLGLPSQNIVCVPGNHDIQLGHQRLFDGYSRAVFEVTGNSAMAQATEAFQYVVHGCEFLLINSAFHLDKDFGKVDCQAINKITAKPVDATVRIVVVHHHPIPVVVSDRSAIVNAYEFLRLVSGTGFDVLLHGHQHAAMSLMVGRQTLLAGVGSINFKPEANINNQFNIVDVGKKVIRFRYLADSTKPGRLGTWESTHEDWPPRWSP